MIAADPEQELLELMAECSKDPLKFVMIAFPWGEPGPLQDFDGPDEWAVGVLTDIKNGISVADALLRPVRLCVSSGHGIGKSACVSWLILWNLATMTDSKGIVTANTEDQLRKKTWAEVSKWFNLLICKHWFKLTKSAIFSADPEKSETWRFDMSTWSEHNTEAFAGLHNQKRRLLLIFDEASGIPQIVWEVANGALTDKETEIIWCAFGNPTQNSGAFYDCFYGAEARRWKGRKVDSRTVKVTNKAELAEEVKIHGEESDRVKVRIRGEFPSSSSNQFIGRDPVQAARKRVIEVHPADPIVIACDVARFGDDDAVITVRRGRDCDYRKPVILPKSDVTQLAGMIGALAKELSPEAINIDGGGVGGGVIDILRNWGWAVNEVLNNHASADRKYASRGDSMWGTLRDEMPKLRLPDDDRLERELTTRLFKYDNDSRIKLESKDEMKARRVGSPDFADSIALLWAVPVGTRDIRKDDSLSRGEATPQFTRQTQKAYNPYGGV